MFLYPYFYYLCKINTMKIKNVKDLLNSQLPCKACCNLYTFDITVNYIKSTALYEASNNDAADLLPFNDAGRSGSSAIHYINWLEIDGENVLDTESLYTDCFRNRFTETSIAQ